MTGLDADKTDQAASTPHATRPAFLRAAKSHPSSALPPPLPPASTAEHATRQNLGRRGRQSAAPAAVGEAIQDDDAMPTRAVACPAAEKKNRVGGCRFLVVLGVATPVFYLISLSLFSRARPGFGSHPFTGPRTGWNMGSKGLASAVIDKAL
jgi:hypothetical protein